MKRIASIFASFLFLAISCGPALGPEDFLEDRNQGEESQESHHESKMEIIFFDVGQGDAALIKTPSGRGMLIDAGPTGAGKDKILPYLTSAGPRRIEHIFVSHYHADHIGSLPELLGQGAIHLAGKIIDRGNYPLDDDLEEFAPYCEAFDPLRNSTSAGEKFSIDEVEIEVAASGGLLSDGRTIETGNPPDENALSLALIVRFGEFSAYFGGDLTAGGGDPPNIYPDVEGPLAEIIGEIDLIKVSHHGSKSSTSAKFLDATAPSAAIISVGDGNGFGHPDQSVISAMVDRGIEIHQTERGATLDPGVNISNGDILVTASKDGSFEISHF